MRAIRSADFFIPPVRAIRLMASSSCTKSALLSARRLPRNTTLFRGA